MASSSSSRRSRSPSSPPPPAPKRLRVPQVTSLVCPSCNVACNSQASWQRHVASAQHRQRVQEPPRADFPGPGPRPRHGHGGPFSRLPHISSSAQLARVIDDVWHSFGEETVQALFHLRRRRLLHSARSDQLARTTDVEDFSALMLSLPFFVLGATKLARAYLACSDLPQRDPVLVLDASSRRRLQTQCLHALFSTTVLSSTPRLLFFAVNLALDNGTASALILDGALGVGYLASIMADCFLTSAALPDSSLHSEWHRAYSVRPSAIRRRRSEADLHLIAPDDSRECFCSVDEDELQLVRQEAAEFLREYIQVLRDADLEEEEEAFDDFY